MSDVSMNGSDTSVDGSGAVGQQGLNDSEHPYNTVDAFIQQALGRIGTVKLVKIKGVSEIGGLGPVGFVDVQPLINLVDGLLGNSQQHGTIFHLPYFRIQGGKNAVIADPAVGDIGFAVICDRDISSAKENKDVSNPGSFRRFDLADGIYIGGVLNDTPEQYVQFTSTGIKIADKNGNSITSSSAGWDVVGDWRAAGAVYAGVGGADQIGLQTHHHAGTNLPPTPGS